MVLWGHLLTERPMAQWPGPSINDLVKWWHSPSSPDSDEVSMSTADTEYSWTIPDGCREFALTLQDATVAWRYSGRTGDVSTVGGGTPRLAGQSISWNDGFYTGTVYFAHSEGSTQVMRIDYLVAGS